MIPNFAPGSEHLPVGRFTTDFDEIRQRFVLDQRFKHDTRRSMLWDGLIGYLAAWTELEDAMAEHLRDLSFLRLLWLGGSFISSKAEPDNVDIALFIRQDAVEACAGKPGSGTISKLSHRDAMKEEFNVSPVVIRFRPVVSPFVIGALPAEEREYLGFRGGFDEWWMRTRDPKADSGEPSAATLEWVRGYVEVIL